MQHVTMCDSMCTATVQWKNMTSTCFSSSWSAPIGATARTTCIVVILHGNCTCTCTHTRSVFLPKFQKTRCNIANKKYQQAFNAKFPSYYDIAGFNDSSLSLLVQETALLNLLNQRERSLILTKWWRTSHAYFWSLGSHYQSSWDAENIAENFILMSCTMMQRLKTIGQNLIWV